MTIKSTSKQFRRYRLRRKVDPGGAAGAADPARFEWTDGNGFDVTVGGTASDGNYVITITPVAPNGAAVPVADPSLAAIPITVVRAAGAPATNTNLATQFVTETNTLLAAANPGNPAALATYIESVSSSGAVVSFIAKKGPPQFTVATSETTATGTLTLAPDDVFPITFDTLGWGPQVGARSKLAISLQAVNSSGVVLDPGTVTADLTVRCYFDRGTRSERDIPNTPVGVDSADIESAHPAGIGFRIPAGAGRFGVSLGAAAGTPGSGTMSHLEAWVVEVSE
jgi:hypothetical protein